MNSFKLLLELTPRGKINHIEQVCISSNDLRKKNNLLLRAAASEGRADILRNYRYRGLSADDARQCNNVALISAAASGHTDVLKELKKYGLSKKDAQADNNTALRKAVLYGKLESVKELRKIFELDGTDASIYRHKLINIALNQQNISMIRELIYGYKIDVSVGDIHPHNIETYFMFADRNNLL